MNIDPVGAVIIGISLFSAGMLLPKYWINRSKRELEAKELERRRAEIHAEAERGIELVRRETEAALAQAQLDAENALQQAQLEYHLSVEEYKQEVAARQAESDAHYKLVEQQVLAELETLKKEKDADQPE